MKLFKIITVCFIISLTLPQANHAQLLPNYTNSWIGNTFGTPANHIPHSIDNMYVTPSGKVATITGWEEGGHNVAVYNTDGTQLGIPVESGTGSWGRNSGNAVFIDDQYVYQIMKQNGCDGANSNPNQYPQTCGIDWHCVRRYNLNGSAAPFLNGKGYDGSFLIVHIDITNTDYPLNGIVILNNELYVSDRLTQTIKVYNASTMAAAIVREMPINHNGLLDYDSQGNLWCLDIMQQKLVRFSPTGTVLSQQITFPTALKATAFCIDKVNNRILVTNNGVDQNVVIYTNIFVTPSQTATFGQIGGIHSGTMGEIAPLKFSEPKGVGVDNNGNIYVGNNGVWQGGGRLEKYNSTGALQWRLNGLMFTDNGNVDPTSEVDFYSKEFHLQLNLNNTAHGTEWSLKGMTINRFAFPEDDRIGNSRTIFWTTAFVKNILGKRILFVTDMYGRRLVAHKFNTTLYGEAAIPSVYFDHNSNTNTEFIWTDSNNDKLHQVNEYDNTAIRNRYSTHIIPDQNGNVWRTYRENGIRYFPFQGFDAHDNPKYAYATSTLFSNPSGVHDVKRVEYDNQSGALYVAGRTSAGVSDNWGCTGDILAKYSNYLTNPNALPTWSISTPFHTEGTVAADQNIKAFCTAGDYIFSILTKYGKVVVRQKSTGNVVGNIMPTSVTNFVSGWSDINGAIQAHKRANGEYLIFAEENSNGKIMMYRWTPSSAIPVELLAFLGKNTEGGNLLTWATASEKNNAGFDIETSTDGVDFEKIGFVKGNGTTNFKQNYNFLDKMPLADLTYYRLQQTDIDGTKKASPTITIQKNGRSKGLKVYPNPTNQSEISVEFNDDTEGSLLVVNVIGQTVFQQKSTPFGRKKLLKIDISSWSSGVYFVKSGQEVMKFVKN